MFESLRTYVFQLAYMFTHVTFADVLDMFLVAIVFFVVFQALHRTRSLQLLRGVVIIAILGAALLVLLPLNTFGWLVRGLLLAGVIALPLLFQDELRRALTGLGQFRRRAGYGTSFERFRYTIISTVKQLASRHEGALIVLEGNTPLDDIIATGIPLHAEALTPELLTTIFQPNTPLHDGAVILRGDQLVAAGCILPLETEKTGSTHLGTRHRAALGLSVKVPNALTVVVSEETSSISVTRAGHIYMGLSLEQLEEELNNFRAQITGESESRLDWLRGGGLASNLLNLTMAIGLSVVAWVSVNYQTNPPQLATIEDIPLVVTGPSPDVILMSDIPESIQVQAQTTLDRIDALDASSVRAELVIENLPADIYRVPVDVDLADERAQLVSIKPAFLDVNLEPKLTIEITPTVIILDPDTLPLGYTLGDLSISPESVTLQGPESLIEQVAEVRAEITLDGRRADFQETVPLTLWDNTGQPIEGLRPTPEKILVTVPIERTLFTREIAIQAKLDMNSLELGYEVTGVKLSPATVTLLGTPNTLASAGDFLVTAPISLTNVFSEITVDTPLILPEGVPAIDDNGENVTYTTVHITVVPITNYLVLNVRPVLRGLSPGLYALLSPSQVSVLLTGPQQLLTEIRNNPTTVTIYLDVTDLTAGTYSLPVETLIPQEVEVELFPPEVQVTLQEQAES